MKIKLSLITFGLTAVMASSAFAGDIKPLHASRSNQTLPATAGQYCDVFVFNSNGAKAYNSAAVIDKSTVQPPKLGVKVGTWVGDAPTANGNLPANGDCVAGTGGQAHAWHVTAANGLIAYDHGHSNVAGHGGLNTAWAGAAGHTLTDQWQSPDATGTGCVGNTCTADNNPRMSIYSNKDYSQYYCVQVCKYPSNQHIPGGADSTTGAETYDVHSHAHNAAPAGHNPANHVASTFIRNLCIDQIWGTCAFNY
jgi:hypothetical protein